MIARSMKGVSVLAVSLLSGWGSWAQTTSVVATIPVGTGPIAMAFNTVTNCLYVANQGSNTVSVIASGTNTTIATIPVGTGPSAIAINMNTNTIYVADKGSKDVAVIDGTTNSVTGIIPVNFSPVAIAVDPRTSIVYAGTNFGPGLAAINGATVTYPDVNILGSPLAMIVNPLTGRVYVADWADSAIEQFEGGTNFLLGVFTASYPAALTTNPAVGNVYAAEGGGHVPSSAAQAGIIDDFANTYTVVAAGINPYSMAADASRNVVFVANESPVAGQPATVDTFDGTSGSIIATVSVGQTPVPAPVPVPNKIAVDPGGALVYVSNEASNDVSVFSSSNLLSSPSVTNIPVGTTPSALMLGAQCELYVANFGSSTVSVLRSTASGPAMCFSSSYLVFGSQVLATSSAPQTFTFINNGSSALSVNSIAVTGDFSETNNCAPGALSPGQLCTIQVTFTPSAQGLRSGQILISTNLGTNPQVIALAGDGVAPSTTQMTVTPNPSVYGQVLSLAATVTSSGTGTPTGTITFSLNGNILSTVPLATGAKASFATAFLLPVGSQQDFTAQYNGDPYFAASTSPAVAQVVNKASTFLLGLYVSPLPPTSPQTLTASVDAFPPGGGIPTGNVVFREGQTVIGTGALANGVTNVPAGLAGGSHSISVSYQGDSNFLPSVSSQPLIVAVPISTVTTLKSSLPSPISTYGTTVTLTATVTPSISSGGNLSGTVIFRDGPNFIGSLVLSGTASSGSVVTPAFTFPVGYHSITAQYVPGQTTLFLGSKSGSLTLTVTQAGGRPGCACSLTGAYVVPATPPAPSSSTASPLGKYTVVGTVDTSNTATGTSLTVMLNSTNQTVFYGNFPSDANWGFSPDDNRFVVNSVTGGIETVNVYDLTTGTPSNPTTVVNTGSAANLISSGVSFSPSGRYFLYEYIYNANTSTSAATEFAHISIYQVQGVASHLQIYDSGDFPFVSAPGSGEDKYGVLASGFSPDNPETSFIYSYVAGPTVANQTPSQWNLVSLVNPNHVLSSSMLTDVSDTWEYSPCGDVIAVTRQLQAQGTGASNVAEVDLRNTATGADLNPGGYMAASINLLLNCTSSGQQVTDNSGSTQQIVTLAPNTACSNTPTGASVTVVPADSGGSGLAPITVTFTNVSAPGTTSLVASNFNGPTIPAAFQLGAPPLVFDLMTTASFASAEVCIGYSGISFGNSNLSLLHYENGQWVDHTIRPVDTTHQIICASVTSFSPFVVVAQASAQAPLTITANNASRLYGSADPAFTVSYNGFVNGDTPASLSGTLTCNAGDTASSSVGTYAITCSGLSSANYAISYVSGVLTIGLTPLTIAANNATRTYGTVNPAMNNVTYGGFVNGDNAASLSGVLNCSTKATAASPVGSYPITCSGLTSANYLISFVPGVLTINPAPLTIAANNASRRYGANNPMFTGTITGIQNGDNITATYSSVAIPGSPVGTYAIVPSAVDPGAKLGNYTVTLNDGALTVVQALTTTAFGAAPNPSNFGQPVTLTAKVAPVAPGAGTATGNVTFLDGTITLGTVALSSAGTAVFASSSLAIGNHSLTATYNGDPNFSASSSILSPSLAIGPAVTATNVSVSPATVQYSDYTTLTATLSPVTAGGQALAGSVQFYLNGSTVGSPVSINSSGVATLSQLQAALAAGSYPVKAVFSSSNQDFAGNTGTTTQTITQENAFILYSGNTIAQVGTQLILRATVWDSAAAGYPGINPETGPTATIGDITKMWIAFDVYAAGSCGSGVPSTLYAQVALTSMAGVGSATATLSSNSEVTYCVAARLVAGSTGGTNLFYSAPNAESVGLDFYVNSGQFATGGGWVMDPTGSHGNFGFNARYNSSGSPKGQIVYVYRSTYNGILADYIIKSNAVTALQFSGTTYPISSNLQGKVTLQINRASDGYSLFSAGNYTFSATVIDSGQNGTSGKQFSIIVYDTSGVPFHSVAAATSLQGGNVVVHSQ